MKANYLILISAVKHDNLMAMGENVSINDNYTTNVDFAYEVKIQYRLLRKKWVAFVRKHFQKKFINILYITVDNPPINYITSLQKQYPDKVIQILTLVTKENVDYTKTGINIDYFIQNQNFTASICLLPSKEQNIKIYGIYSDFFSELKSPAQIYDIKYIGHFVKIARKFALKIKPDIIHADNVPFLLGLEFGNRLSSGYPVKFIQSLHDFSTYKDIEPFWAAINLMNKNEMKRICKDKEIKKDIAALFNIKETKHFTKLRECFDYLYKNYDNYRDKVKEDEDTNENILIERLNQRITKMFPSITTKNTKNFNPILHSIKKANSVIINSIPKELPAWFYGIKEYKEIIKKECINNETKIKHNFDNTNFREIRSLNKKYFIRELSEKRIETKFVDLNLFASDEVKIYGYLDSLYKSPLIYIPINEFVQEQHIKTASIALLKLYELRKFAQIVYTFPKDYKNSYLKALLEFFESQSLLDGKWVGIEGEVNLSQFMAAADIVLIPTGDFVNSENILYTALKYGSVPVVDDYGILNNLVIDIFEDMNNGCGFKINNDVDISINSNDISDTQQQLYSNTLVRAYDFYTHNNAGWNLIIKNALSYNRSWDFKTVESYNESYNEII